MLYDFTLVPRRLSEFEGMCRHHQTSPESHFTRNRVCSILTPRGRVTLTGKGLVITEEGERRESALATTQEYDAALEGFFGIRLDAVPSTGT